MKRYAKSREKRASTRSTEKVQRQSHLGRENRELRVVVSRTGMCVERREEATADGHNAGGTERQQD